MAPPMAPANGPKTAPRNFKVPPVNEVVKNARDFWPESAMFYVLTKKEFDEELWNDIKTSWLEPGSTIPKETVWKLVHQLRLESVKATSIEDEDLKACQYVAEAEELELVFSTPYPQRTGIGVFHSIPDCGLQQEAQPALLERLVGWISLTAFSNPCSDR